MQLQFKQFDIEKMALLLILLHIVLGVMGYIFPLFSIGVNIFVTGFVFLMLFTYHKNPIVPLYMAAYLVGSDLFFRMTKGAFLWEQTKYVIILIMTIGLFFRGHIPLKNNIYLLFFLLLIPGVVVTFFSIDFDESLRKSIAFNLSGPVCLALSALYCMNLKITYTQIKKILFLILLPVISIGTYMYLYTPRLEAVLTNTASNAAASGGFGANQVSTILGLGLFVLVTRIFLYAKAMLWKIIYGVLFFFFLYRGLLTFSRGGIITAFVISGVFIVFLTFVSAKSTRYRIYTSLFLFVFILVSTWVYSNTISSGLLEKRYANQDALGREKDDITTGRAELFMLELQAFTEHPLLGVGVGKVDEFREDILGSKMASHNEVSRMFAEHGLLGVFALVILLSVPLIVFFTGKGNIYTLSFYLFWFLTINHSAMRLAAPAFIYALSLLTITNEYKPTIYRQQVNR